MTALERFVAERNGDLMVDVAMKGGMGLVATGLVFGSLWWLSLISVGVAVGGWGGAARVAFIVTGIYLAVACWSALRDVDPLAHLAPLTRAERTKREAEEAVAELVGGGGGLNREGIAGLGGCLLAGPQGLVGAWRAWRRRVVLDAATLAEADRLLAQDGAPVAGRERAAIALVALGLARLEAGDDGRVVALATAKGKQVRA